MKLNTTQSQITLLSATKMESNPSKETAITMCKICDQPIFKGEGNYSIKDNKLVSIHNYHIKGSN